MQSNGVRPEAEEVIGIIRKKWARAQKPVMLVDFGVGRFGLEGQVRRMMNELGVPTYNSESAPE